MHGRHSRVRIEKEDAFSTDRNLNREKFTFDDMIEAVV